MQVKFLLKSKANLNSYAIPSANSKKNSSNTTPKTINNSPQPPPKPSTL